MKLRKISRPFPLILFTLVLAGCLEIDTSTTVNRDGSLHRSVTVQGDSLSIYAREYTVPIDSTWTEEVRKIDGRKFEMTASRDFSDIEEFNREIAGVQGKTLRSVATIEERFRWFTSIITYRERVLRLNPVDEIPITDYLSQSEIDMAIEHEILKQPFATAGDSLSLDDASRRFDEWIKRNIFAAYVKIFIEGVRKVNDDRLTVDYVRSREDSLYDVLSGVGYQNLTMQRAAFREVLNRPPVDEAFGVQEDEFRRLGESLAFVEDISKNTYRNSVVMPGLIVNTNASSLEGNRASWNSYLPITYFQDFDMWVTTQVINWWAIGVTGVLVLGGLILLLIAPFRRKRCGAL